MAADIVFDGENMDGSGVGAVKICCMHDPYDLRCPVCGHSVFSRLLSLCGGKVNKILAACLKVVTTPVSDRATGMSS